MLSKLNNLSTYNHFLSTQRTLLSILTVMFTMINRYFDAIHKNSHLHKYGEIVLIQWAFRIIPIRLLEVAHEPIKQGLLCYEIYFY